MSAFVRLGWRERAHELLDFFMAGRRPAAWNQWPEVVGRDPRKPRFVGDMPHAWVASDYIRSVLDLFAYERSDGRWSWPGHPRGMARRAGVSIRGCAPRTGRCLFAGPHDERVAELTLIATGAFPPGGFVIAGPWPRPAHATVNGKSVAIRGDELRIDELEAKVVIQFGR